MKALSIRPDYAIDILAGNKKIEYRSWNTDYRGDLLICSTAKKIKGTIPGHALIVCQIADVKKLAEKKFAWKLENFRDIEPFKIKGQQGFFNVDDSLIKFMPDLNDEQAEQFVDEHFTPLFI